MPDITVQTTVSPITVTPTRLTVTAATSGVQGPQGAQGPPGLDSKVHLYEMLDVVILNPQNHQFLKYNNGLWTNVDTQIIDGGNW